MPEITVPAEEVFPILRENILVDGFHVVIDLEKSHGAVISDALTGKEYLDCYGYFATLPVGHNHAKMEDEGFRRSLMTAALANPANSDIYSREFAAFVKTFRQLAVPDDFRFLFFIAGGALAVENAMKAAFDWKVQKNRALGIEGGGDKILHFVDAFHGRSGYTLSVTNTDPAKTDDFPKFDWPRISSPFIEDATDEGAVAAKEARACAEIEAAFEADPHGIAAILVEPMQAEGGDHHFRPAFFEKPTVLGVGETGLHKSTANEAEIMEAQIELARECFTAQVPGFGSCWAAQIAVVAAGGLVQANPNGREMGIARKIKLTEEGRGHPLYEGKETVFDAFISHVDEITHLPAGAVSLSGNAFTRVQSVSVIHDGGVFWGLQYHPEYDLREMARLTWCRIEKLMELGFFKDYEAGETHVELLETLHNDPSRYDIAWKLGIDGDIMNQDVRQLEVRNWIENLVMPTMAIRR